MRTVPTRRAPLQTLVFYPTFERHLLHHTFHTRFWNTTGSRNGPNGTQPKPGIYRGDYSLGVSKHSVAVQSV